MEITVHECADGGVLYEFYRDEEFGQLAVRTVPPGVTAGGHRHPITNEFWLVFRGEGVVYLEYPDGIKEMLRISGDKPRVILLPAGTGHDIKNTGEDELAFIFFADRVYHPETHDKEPWEWR